MMEDHSMLRRDFLWLASAVPFVFAHGCSSGGSKPTDSEEAIKTLILAVGPWGDDRRNEAEYFATRFVAARGVSQDFLAQGEPAKSLTSRAPFRDKPLALESLDLSGCSEAERNLLTSLITLIYGLLEMHYVHVAGMPDIGLCAEREWYTRAPSEW